MSRIDPPPPPEGSFRPRWEVAGVAPAPAVAPPAPQAPSPPHPDFWWALAGCGAALLLPQVPGGVVAVVVIFLLIFLLPGQRELLRPGETADLMRSLPVQVGIGIGLWVAH